jgi:hypothetical protein
VKKQITALESAVVLHSAQILAMECLLRAMIVTHPNRAQLKDAFQRIAAELEQRLADAGFENGLPVDSARTLVEPFHSRTDDWITWVDLIAAE